MKNKIIEYTRNLLNNTPDDWIKLTTHRLDIYDEKLAKIERKFYSHLCDLFLEIIKSLNNKNLLKLKK